MNHSHHHHHDSGHFEAAVRERLESLSLYPDQFGHLEELAVQLCTIQQSHHPSTTPRTFILFAADHGIAQECASPLQPATEEIIQKLMNDDTFLHTLTEQHQVKLTVLNAGVSTAVPGSERKDEKFSSLSARNFCTEPAMTIAEVKKAMKIGSDAVADELNHGTRVFIFGAIGNATELSAAAIAACLLATDALEVLGPGYQEHNLLQAIKLVQEGVDLHREAITNPITLLASLGGPEIAAMVGAMLQAGGHHGTILIDGFVTTVAAAVASQLSQDVQPSLVACHTSSHPAPDRLYNLLQVNPIFNFDISIRDGSAALLALPVLDCISALLAE
ncbi:MAG: nicotinate-nucleotide--dimethylbenzimidazole phosphoribosyltransferase [bacterium]|jgi:nicotinate-nucleotide--dimethylbenzimidazole phosphoribosyltransferase